MIKAVLFDLDGTLVNSLDDLADSCNYALEKSGFAVHETEKYKYFVGDGMQKLVERVLPVESRDAETKARVFDIFINRYRNHFADKTVAYNGIEEVIKSLKANGFKLAIVSNKAQEMAVTVTEKLFGSLFDIICGKREGYPPKPNPRLTLEVIGDLKYKPSECVLIGDSGMDAQAAVNAGCIGIGVLWGFRTREELVANGASFIVNSPAEILSIIEDINNEK